MSSTVVTMDVPGRDEVAPADDAAERDDAAGVRSTPRLGGSTEQPEGARPPAPRGLTRFALFAEVLLTSVYVTVLSLPIVTVVPAVTAGVAHLRRHLDATDDSVGTVWADFRAACRGVWLVSVGAVVALFLVVLDLWAVSTGALPGGLLVGVVSGLAGLLLVVALLRAAGAWTPGAAWWPLARDAARGIPADVGGSLLLVAALAVCVVLVWMLTPLVIVVGGLLCFAVVAVGFRRP